MPGASTDAGTSVTREIDRSPSPLSQQAHGLPMPCSGGGGGEVERSREGSAQ